MLETTQKETIELEDQKPESHKKKEEKQPPFYPVFFQPFSQTLQMLRCSRDKQLMKSIPVFEKKKKKESQYTGKSFYHIYKDYRQEVMEQMGRVSSLQAQLIETTDAIFATKEGIRKATQQLSHFQKQKKELTKELYRESQLQMSVEQYLTKPLTKEQLDRLQKGFSDDSSEDERETDSPSAPDIR